MGIQKYWIVDYLGIGERRYIGSPKQPTLTIFTLVEGEYELKQYRDQERLISLAFPDLQLTIDQVFKVLRLPKIFYWVEFFTIV